MAEQFDFAAFSQRKLLWTYFVYFWIDDKMENQQKKEHWRYNQNWILFLSSFFQQPPLTQFVFKEKVQTKLS